MQLNLSINLKEDADPMAVGQLVAWALRLDKNALATSTATEALSTVSATMPAAELVPPGGNGHDPNPTWTGPAPGGVTHAEAAATAAAAPPPAAPAADKPPSRRGRKPAGASTAAEQAAALGTEPAPAPAAPPAAAVAPAPAAAVPPGVAPHAAAPAPAAAAAPPAGFAVPPGMSAPATPAAAIPPTAAPAPAAPAPAAPASSPAAAMPTDVQDILLTAPILDERGHIVLDDFKARCMAMHKRAQAVEKTKAFPFNIVRADTWPASGEAKPFKAISLDGVPAEWRQRVLEESVAMFEMG